MTDPEVCLLCFPYAGAGASVYLRWASFLPRRVALHPVQPPGRETRAREESVGSIVELAQRFADEVSHRLDGPYALFGHSMGALVAFELAREVRRRGGRDPLHLFVSGCAGPQPARLLSSWLDLPDEDLLVRVAQLGGAPSVVQLEPPLRSYAVRVLRSDLTACATYQYRDEAPLAMPITALAGSADPVARPEAVGGWRHETVAGFELVVVPGNHFFVTSAPALVTSIVAGALAGRSPHDAC